MIAIRDRVRVAKKVETKREREMGVERRERKGV